MAEHGEGRLARWSRLKAKGGASETENKQAARVDELPAEADAPARPTGFEDLPDPSTLPGGVQKRRFVPPMAPLADLDEVDEDTPAYEAPPPEALAMLNGELTPPPGSAVPVEALDSDLPERELTEEEAAAVRDLPPLETLTKESDFTPFLADNIPEFIRNRALKILWRSDPLFGFQDGLDDYAENFRVIDKLIDAATESSYRPGKGYDFPDEEEVEDDDGEEEENGEGEDADVAEQSSSSGDERDGEAPASVDDVDELPEADVEKAESEVDAAPSPDEPSAPETAV